MLFKRTSILVAFAFTTSLLFFAPKIFAESADHILIAEVQIAGDSARDEFVRLYNPTDSTVDLTGWKLTKKSSTGTESNLKTDFEATIAPHGYYLIGHSSDYHGTEPADSFYSVPSNNISFDNSLLLYDAESVLIDKLGLGEAQDYETEAAPNPALYQSLVRTPVDEDTGNNFVDFVLSAAESPSPSPTPSVSPSPTPTTTPTTTPTIAPTLTPTPTPTPLPTFEPTPSPTSVPGERVIARFESPFRTTICYLKYQTIRMGFGQISFPRIVCSHSWH